MKHTAAVYNVCWEKQHILFEKINVMKNVMNQPMEGKPEAEALHNHFAYLQRQYELVMSDYHALKAEMDELHQAEAILDGMLARYLSVGMPREMMRSPTQPFNFN